MERAAERANRVAPKWRDDDVHDLRVALRRCRAMADALREVNPAPGWRKLKRSSRELFHALGALRDAQVERSWIRQLSESGDAGRKYMLRALSRKMKQDRRTAAKALDDFDAKGWAKLSRKLEAKSHFFPLESVVFQRLALAKLNEAAELYRRATKNPSGAAWHRVRIAMKAFRYIVENFLPQRYESWAESLKSVQDALGDVHDLDVLEAELCRHSANIGEVGLTQWKERIQNLRRQRLRGFLAQFEGPDSIWEKWRAGFHAGQVIKAAPFPEAKTA